MSFAGYWYVVALSEELSPGKVVRRKVLGEWLAVYRGEDGRPAVLRDRCMHRAAPLSEGKVIGGCLRCPYHGWQYDAEGQVTAIPSEGVDFKQTRGRRTTAFPVREQDGYVYTCLDAEAAKAVEPFKMPRWGEPGWASLRLVNRFRNDVTNCAENFIDVPHTVFVHTGIFRTERQQKIEARVRRVDGAVRVSYRNETSNLGWFAWFLNPSGGEIVHEDNFFMPNVTSVEYRFSPNRAMFITSQSVPCADDDTLVYTDLTYNFGQFTRFAAPILRFQGQRVIDQDLVALAQQRDVIEKYGDKFANTAADVIHVFVESIREAIRDGRDPRALPERDVTVSFWV